MFNRIIFENGSIKSTAYLIFIMLLTTACTSDASDDKGKAMCRNLSKINDIDEILYQMYSNIDSNCLFNMPTKDLEKIWGIRIFDLTNQDKLDEFQSYWQQPEPKIFLVKQNDKSSLSFSIEVSASYTKKYNGWGGSIGQGNFPKLLPTPQINFLKINSSSKIKTTSSPLPKFTPINEATVYKEYGVCISKLPIWQ